MSYLYSNYYFCSGWNLKQFRPSKTQNQNHENPLLQKFNDMYTQVLNKTNRRLVNFSRGQQIRSQFFSHEDTA